MKDKKAITVKTLSKSNVWDLQENDIFRLLEAVEKDTDLKENMRHYTDIIKTAFDIEEIKVDKPEIIKKYEDRGFKVAQIGKPEDGRPKPCYQEATDPESDRSDLREYPSYLCC